MHYATNASQPAFRSRRLKLASAKLFIASPVRLASDHGPSLGGASIDSHSPAVAGTAPSDTTGSTNSPCSPQRSRCQLLTPSEECNTDSSITANYLADGVVSCVYKKSSGCVAWGR